jgi:hypothetical protein
MKLRELLQQMAEIQKKIGSSEAYICGGTPRDRYLKHLENISDLDITTGDKTVGFLSQELGSELSKKYNVTRRSHDDGHSSIYIGSFKMDFSSNYNVPNIINILKTKAITNPTEMQKEMFSRDFTCNALLLSLDLKNLIDPTHYGFNDIKDKMIRTCLDPQITLTSNKNRVIRAIYLASKLDFNIDPSIIEFVGKNPQTVKIASDKVLSEKLNEAFNRDADKASYYISKMNLWNQIPITEVVQPYYMKAQNGMVNKKAYFQGGGGVNEPTPKEKKYKSDPAIVNQVRFKEPFYHNYDIYEIPGFEHIGPGAGWHSLQNYKSISDFLAARRERMKSKYRADDSWILDSGKKTKENPGIKARANLLSQIIKTARMPGGLFHKLHQRFKDQNCVDENDGPNFDYGKEFYANMDKYKSVKDFEEHADKGPVAFFADDNAIDFPIDEYIDPDISATEPTNVDGGNPAGEGNLIGGYLDEYLPENDFEGKMPTSLDFGRDYIEGNSDEKSSPVDLKSIENLLNKYLSHGLYGLPDGVDLPDEDLEESKDLNSDYGTRGPDSLIYEDKWNI